MIITSTGRPSDEVARRKRMSLEGTVVNGVVILDNGHDLPDGTRVELVVKVEEKSPATLGQRLLKLAGIAKGLPPDMAEQHDHYLYGTPKR
jgi:hypothetical protein